MFTGLLRVSGTITLSQFWPAGGSDADTASVAVSAKSFEFSPDPSNKPFRQTRVFEGAQISKKLVIHSGKVTVRFQGIDAPELHFPPLLPKKGLKGNGTKYRQLQGETSTDKLETFVTSGKPKTVPCQVVTRIDKPDDAFDLYARLIGDILVGAGAKQVNLTHWLAQNGWAYPSYYNSMLPSEIRALQKLCNQARAKGRGIWPFLTKVVGAPDLTLTFRPGGPFNAKEQQADKGHVVMPKFFRRRVRYAVLRLNNLPPATFRDYLKSDKNAKWTTLAAFLKTPNMKPPKNTLADLLTIGDVVQQGPGDLVFFEAPARLMKNGKPVTAWTFV
jgi:endonuclease YncB( thermonuclease family)